MWSGTMTIGGFICTVDAFQIVIVQYSGRTAYSNIRQECISGGKVNVHSFCLLSYYILWFFFVVLQYLYCDAAIHMDG